jgi:hypothetical protein
MEGGNMKKMPLNTFFGWPGLTLECTWSAMDNQALQVPDLDFTWTPPGVLGCYLDFTWTPPGQVGECKVLELVGQAQRIREDK